MGNTKYERHLKSFYWKDYLSITIGLLLYAIGLVGFIKPQGLVVGGTTGIGLLVEYASGFPFQYTYLIINAGLLVIALKVLGSKFLVKTIYGVVMLTLLIDLMETLLATTALMPDEPFLASIIGGIACGAGVGIVLSVNGSTGGTDTAIAIISKYKHISYGRGVLLIDLTIILSSYFLNEDYRKVIISLIILGIMSYAIDMVVNEAKRSVQFLIISDKYEEIATAINIEMRRGCTLLEGMGWYTKKPSKVILVLTNQSQAIEMVRLIRDIDEKAFISQSETKGVYGEGFDKLRR